MSHYITSQSKRPSLFSRIAHRSYSIFCSEWDASYIYQIELISMAILGIIRSQNGRSLSRDTPGGLCQSTEVS